MWIARRILDAVTPRRVLVALLVGGFAKEILSSIGWLASVGHALGEVGPLRALLLAGLRLALDVGLICLALRGLRSLAAGRWRRRGGEGAGRETEAADRPGEGGGDDDDRDHR